MTRAILVASALLSPFFFPFPYTVALMFIAACAWPPSALIAGVLVDALYFVPHAAAVPLGILSGTLLAAAGFFVQRFMKTRVVDL